MNNPLHAPSRTAGAADAGAASDVRCGGSPADVYLTVFRAGTTDVAFASLAEAPDELVRVAAALRAAEGEVCRWLGERLGWDRPRARDLTQAFALEVGGSLLDRHVDFDSLRDGLERIWISTRS
jgi:hypothetical protein